MKLTCSRFIFTLLFLNMASFGEDRLPISLVRLQHKVPKKAQQEFFAAKNAWERGDTSKAALHLEKSVAIDHDFFEAVNNLGVMYLRADRFKDACQMFHRATKIDSGDSQAEANLAYVLLNLNRLSEAEDAARASLRGDPGSGRARIFLAVSLISQNKGMAEAVFHLKKASGDFVEARRLLEDLETEGVK